MQCCDIEEMSRHFGCNVATLSVDVAKLIKIFK